MPTVVIPVARANHWHSPHWLLRVNQQIRRYSIKAVTDGYLFYSIPVLISGIHFQKMVCEFILFKKNINIFQVHSVTRNWKTLNPSSQYAFIVTSVSARHQTGLTYEHTYTIRQLLVSMLAQHFKIIASLMLPPIFSPYWSNSGLWGCWSPSLLSKGEKQGTTCTGSQSCWIQAGPFLCRFCMHSSFLPQS